MNTKSVTVTGCLALLLIFSHARAEDAFRACADLPPLLRFNDGAEVKPKADLERRKREVAVLLQRYFIGTFPGKVPALLSAKVLDERRAQDGSLRRRVQLTFDTPKKASFEVRVWVPKGEGPFPILLTQPRYYQLRWAELALERGYIACLYPGVDSHHREKDFPRYESVWQDFRREYPKATWSEISTKAWLAGRTLDYLLAPASGYRFAPGKVGIIGFSRYGKQSLIAAAFDERITSVVARSPGSPGSCPYRFTSRNTCAEAPRDFPSEWFRPSLRS
ncbi:MAG: CocE/NonD family hydrolase, partial [Planctomycetes bacterium]|nr:CocE/NonD family hydrolase [Planctomycetota bacterium]